MLSQALFTKIGRSSPCRTSSTLQEGLKQTPPPPIDASTPGGAKFPFFGQHLLACSFPHHFYLSLEASSQMILQHLEQDICLLSLWQVGSCVRQVVHYLKLCFYLSLHYFFPPHPSPDSKICLHRKSLFRHINYLKC